MTQTIVTSRACLAKAFMAQIYPEHRGQNYAVRSGNRGSAALLRGVESADD
jgi:hypothetical protein